MSNRSITSNTTATTGSTSASAISDTDAPTTVGFTAKRSPAASVVERARSHRCAPPEPPGERGDRARGERAERGAGPEVRVEGVDPEQQGPSEREHERVGGREADREHATAADRGQPPEVAVLDRVCDGVVPGVVGAREERGRSGEQQLRAASRRRRPPLRRRANHSRCRDPRRCASWVGNGGCTRSEIQLFSGSHPRRGGRPDGR